MVFTDWRSKAMTSRAAASHCIIRTDSSGARASRAGDVWQVVVVEAADALFVGHDEVDEDALEAAANAVDGDLDRLGLGEEIVAGVDGDLVGERHRRAGRLRARAQWFVVVLASVAGAPQGVRPGGLGGGSVRGRGFVRDRHPHDAVGDGVGRPRARAQPSLEMRMPEHVSATWVAALLRELGKGQS